MTTTCQQLYVRARQSTPANASLITQPAEILARIEAEQQAIFATLAGQTRDRFQATGTLSSNAAAGSRAFALGNLTPPVERVLSVVLADGREAHQVDVLDVEAELSPRYIVRGTTLIEVGNDWSKTAASVAASLVYVYGPTPITPSGSYEQTISIPDAFADLLQLALELYLAQKREPVASDAMIAPKLQERQAAFAAYLTNFGGIVSTRFSIPAPATGNPKT